MSRGAVIAPVGLGPWGPATMANIARNTAGAGRDRAHRWASAREAAWQLLDRHVPQDARVALIGAGNGDDLPLERLAARASQLDLFDLDPAALRRARRTCLPELQARVGLHRLDVTAGAADRISVAVRLGRQPRASRAPERPLGSAAYDVVIGDLLYSQLLYPALLDAGVSQTRIRQALARYGPALTDGVVSRMHASAAAGARVIHLHDIVGWWDGHPQPVSLPEILAQDTLEDAFALIARCRAPVGTDPHDSARRMGARVLERALWEWPFAPGASYLVCATVTAVNGRTVAAACSQVRSGGRGRLRPLSRSTSIRLRPWSR